MLLEAMIRLGLAQGELAKTLGTEPRNLAKIIENERGIGPDMALRLERAGVSPSPHQVQDLDFSSDAAFWTVAGALERLAQERDKLAAKAEPATKAAKAEPAEEPAT